MTEETQPPKEAEELQIGKTYQHRTAKTVCEIIGIEPVKYTDGIHHHYKVKVVYCDINAGKGIPTYNILLLPDTEALNWKEVVVDCDGLVYQLN